MTFKTRGCLKASSLKSPAESPLHRLVENPPSITAT